MNIYADAPATGVLHWVRNVFVAGSRLLNSIFAGNPRQTLSGRCGGTDCKPCRFLCRILDIFDTDHCKKWADNEEV